jgi:dTDP-4-dehydrorhamnose 3,5-epimerase
LYVPEGFAHGFLTLEENCEVFYQVSNYYSQPNERGVRWNDPLFDIDWGVSEHVISDKDKAHPDCVKIN